MDVVHQVLKGIPYLLPVGLVNKVLEAVQKDDDTLLALGKALELPGDGAKDLRVDGPLALGGRREPEHLRVAKDVLLLELAGEPRGEEDGRRPTYGYGHQDSR